MVRFEFCFVLLVNLNLLLFSLFNRLFCPVMVFFWKM
jgi:hypothetical protein